ncbi:MAG: S-layer homology domain-containing protein, partial [Chloroflexia bacterium]
NTYRPGNTTSRGQFSKISVTAMGWALDNPGSPTFTDVSVSSTFYTYIETAVSHGIISGYSDGTFRPDEPVTRGQLVKITMLAEAWPPLNPNIPTFNDVSVGSPFFSYVETANARDVIGGYSDGSFRPGGTATRGQVAKVIYYAHTSILLQQEQDTVDIINQRRSSLGLVTLHLNPGLHRATRRHVLDIGPQGLCQHNGTDGSSPWDRAAQAGYTGFAMGEVVGCGYPTPTAVVDGWWNSPGHYAVLTDPNARSIGCGWWLNGQGAGWQACLTGD